MKERSYLIEVYVMRMRYFSIMLCYFCVSLHQSMAAEESKSNIEVKVSSKTFAQSFLRWIHDRSKRNRPGQATLDSTYQINWPYMDVFDSGGALLSHELSFEEDKVLLLGLASGRSQSFPRRTTPSPSLVEFGNIFPVLNADLRSHTAFWRTVLVMSFSARPGCSELDKRLNDLKGQLLAHRIRIIHIQVVDEP